MESFKEYVINEFRVDGFTSVSFSFTHRLTVKIDKPTKKVLNVHTINTTVQFFDKDMNLLRRSTLKFINNVLNKKDAEKLVHISPKELENRFNLARREIVGEILIEYLKRSNEINEKINMLNMYENVNVSHDEIVPSEYKGELIQIKTEGKQKFDM